MSFFVRVILFLSGWPVVLGATAIGAGAFGGFHGSLGYAICVLLAQLYGMFCIFAAIGSR